MYSYDQVDIALRQSDRRRIMHDLENERVSKRLLVLRFEETLPRFSDDANEVTIEDAAMELLALANRAVDIAQSTLGNRMALAELGYLGGLRAADAAVEREIRADDESFEGHLRRERAQDMREDGEGE